MCERTFCCWTYVAISSSTILPTPEFRIQPLNVSPFARNESKFQRTAHVISKLESEIQVTQKVIQRLRIRQIFVGSVIIVIAIFQVPSHDVEKSFLGNIRNQVVARSVSVDDELDIFDLAAECNQYATCSVKLISSQ